MIYIAIHHNNFSKYEKLISKLKKDKKYKKLLSEIDISK